jgi:hypothetical protein
MERQILQRNMRFLVLEIFWAAIAVGCYLASIRLEIALLD